MEKISNEIREQIINSYVDYVKDKLSESQIQTAIRSMRGSGNSIEAHLAVASLIFYQRFVITEKESPNKQFTGNAGGVAGPIPGSFYGSLQSDDFDKLHKKTVSFSYEAATAVIFVQFYDKNSNCLGHFEAAGVGFSGVGGGSGSWE